MGIIGSIANIMSYAIIIAIEDIVGTTGDVDGIDETVFTEGIGKVPEGFLVAGGDVVELVVDAADGATLNFAVKIEGGGDGAVADEDELTEERATPLLNIVLDLIASRNANDAIGSKHSHIAQTRTVTSLTA